ncbi:beta-ketoacyl synthase chain length factor [Myxococcaceae bacterium JPH2]|nr:beta-ketoacyl synthase chain length factor [Myxococcaceae bacterium JPH2]
MSAAILGVGVVAPGATDCASFLRVLSSPPGAPARVESIPDGGDAKTRRLPRLERMALAVARQALPQGVDRDSLALVFGTGYGGLTATVDFLEGMATRGAEFGSPTAFHQSVHHSPAGQLSIALGLRGPSLTVSAREVSGETAVKVALDLLATKRARHALVVAADERIPALDNAYRAFGVHAESPDVSPRIRLEPGEGAAALLLGAESGPLTIEECVLTAHPTAPLRFARPERMSPLLREGLSRASAGASVSLSAPNGEVHDAEDSALGDGVPVGSRWVDTPHLGFHPSAGLLRLVAAVLRLEAPGECVHHGLALGGGQSLTRVRRVAG